LDFSIDFATIPVRLGGRRRRVGPAFKASRSTRSRDRAVMLGRQTPSPVADARSAGALAMRSMLSAWFMFAAF